MSSGKVESFWKEAWALLDRDEPASALRLAQRALAGDPELAEAHYIAGVAEAEMDEPLASLDHHVEAAMLAPEWDEAVVMHMAALVRLARFAEAREVRDALAEEPPDLALFWHVSGLLDERAGDRRGARAAFRRATELEPEAYPPALELDETAFQAIVEGALERLPQEFRDALDNIAIVLEPFPDEALLVEIEPPHDPELLGLYVGTPLTQRSVESSGQTPDVVYLFQRNLERYAPDPETLEREIAVTLYHEIAHALGFEEEDMPTLGLE